MPDEARLEISGWSSRCSACGKGADPKETHHETRLDYGQHDGKGCGALFVAVTSGYGEDAARTLRPDLPWSGSVKWPEVADA